MLVAVCKKYLDITKVQIQKILLVNIGIGIFLVALTPFLFGIKNLNVVASNFILERFVALVGIVLITPLFLPEQDENIAELIASKYTSLSGVQVVRLIISIFVLGGVIISFMGIMVLNHCQLDFARSSLGTFATAFFLGALGYFGAGISKNVVVGYLLAVGYYILSLFVGATKLKIFYLFSLSRALDLNPMVEKEALVSVAVVLITITFILCGLRRRM